MKMLSDNQELNTSIDSKITRYQIKIKYPEEEPDEEPEEDEDAEDAEEENK